MCKLALLKKIIFILVLLYTFCASAQKDSTVKFNRKEELVYDGKRYRKYNNYLTFGVGKGYVDIRRIDQSYINFDYQFHLQRQYFQVGVFMSGDDFLRNTDIQGHLCMGYRIERNKYNLAAFIGPSYSYVLTTKTDPTTGDAYAQINNVMGGYMCIQAVYKIKYDVGIGTEVFGEISSLQKMVGGRIIFFFSGAYRGIKRGPKPIAKPQHQAQDN